MPTNHVEVATMTPGIRTSSQGAFQATDLVETSMQSHIPLEIQTLSTQTFDRTSIMTSTISGAGIRETKIIFPPTETKAFTKMVPSKLMVVITTPMEASATSGSPMGIGMTTVETVTGTDLVESVLDTLCTDDNSEEAWRIVIDILTLAHTSAEAKALALESSAVSDSSVLAIATSQTLTSDATALAKALLAYTITDTKVINCSIIEIETTATTPGTLDINHDPTGAKALSPSEMSALLDSTEAESDSLETMTSAETLSGATEPAMPDTTVETPLPSNSTIEGETAAAKTTTPSTTLVTVSTNPLEETSALSVETSHTESSVTNSTRAGSAVGKVTSPAGLSSMAYSHTQVATSKNPIPSETSATDSTTNGSTPISRSPFPPVHLTVANSSPEANITLVKTTALARTLKTASMTGGNLPTAMPTTAQTKWATEVIAGKWLLEVQSGGGGGWGLEFPGCLHA